MSAIEEFEKDYDEEDEPPGSFQRADMIEESSSLLAEAIAVRKLRAFLDQSALTQSVEDVGEDGR